MKMLRWSLGVASIGKKIRESSLKLFSHVTRRNDAVRVFMKMCVEEKTERERPNVVWIDGIESD